jgi:hypothetical protein
MHAKSALTGFVLVLTVGCSDAANPAAPGSAGTAMTESAAGASIAGALMSPEGSPLAGITVAVARAPISTRSDSDGRFALEKVPAGDIELQFTGGGINAQLPVTSIQNQERLSLAVSLSGSSARLISSVHPTPPPGSESREIEGRIDEIPLSPAGSFGIDGQLIHTNGQTRIRRGDTAATFGDLEIGMRVHVKAIVTGTSIVAAIVMIQNTNTDLPVPLNGTVSDLSGTRAAFAFEIDGDLVRGDANTEFFGNSDFGDLKNGARAEIKGTQKNGYVYADRIHVNRGRGKQ